MLPIQASTRATPRPLPFIFLKPKRGPAVLPFLPPIFYSTSWQDDGRTRCPAGVLPFLTPIFTTHRGRTVARGAVLPFLPRIFYSTSWQDAGRARCPAHILPFLPPIFYSISWQDAGRTRCPATILPQFVLAHGSRTVAGGALPPMCCLSCHPFFTAHRSRTQAVRAILPSLPPNFYSRTVSG